MDPRRFDRLTKALGTYVSRRSALTAGAGLAGLALADSAMAAQDATPEATPMVDGEKLFFLFVQSFEGGSLEPKAGEPGVYVLHLENGHRRTIAFSDRPERIVRSMPTKDFLAGLGFAPENPPNAALIIEPSADETDVIVVELLDPRYDEANMTLDYDVKVLDSFEAGQGMDFHEESRVPHADGEGFGSGHLLIDDCPDATDCYRFGDWIGQIPGGGSYGRCWNWSTFTCDPCGGQAVNQLCNDEYFTCLDLCNVG